MWWFDYLDLLSGLRFSSFLIRLELIRLSLIANHSFRTTSIALSPVELSRFSLLLSFDIGNKPNVIRKSASTHIQLLTTREHQQCASFDNKEKTKKKKINSTLIFTKISRAPNQLTCPSQPSRRWENLWLTVPEQLIVSRVTHRYPVMPHRFEWTAISPAGEHSSPLSLFSTCRNNRRRSETFLRPSVPPFVPLLMACHYETKRKDREKIFTRENLIREQRARSLMTRISFICEQKRFYLISFLLCPKHNNDWGWSISSSSVFFAFTLE